jgi:hypothetical protein
VIYFIYSKYSVTAVPSLKVRVPKYDSMKAYKRGGKIHAFLTTSCVLFFILIVSFSIIGEALLPKLCIKSTTKRWARHVARMVEKRNEYRVLVRKREGSLWPLGCWGCWFESRPGHGCLSLVSVVCCQVEVFATG